MYRIRILIIPCNGSAVRLKLLQRLLKLLLTARTGAIVGALESEHWITSAFYAQNKGSLPDWTSLKVAEQIF